MKIIPIKKSLFLGSIAVLAGGAFWYFFKDSIEFGNLETASIWWSLFALACFTTSLSLLLLFAEHRWLVLVPFILSIVPLVYEFGYQLPILVSLLIAISTLLHAYSRVRKEAESRIHFNISILLREGLPTILTAIALLCAVAYYMETNKAPERITIRDILPRALFETILERAPYVGKNILPGFGTDTTINEYITRELEKNGIVPSLLPSAERDQILTQAREHLFSPLWGNDKSHIPDGSEKLGDVLYDIVTLRGEQFLAPYERFVPLGFAIAFFLFLRTVAIPFSWIVIEISKGIVRLFQANGLIVRVEEQATKEIFKWQ